MNAKKQYLKQHNAQSLRNVKCPCGSGKKYKACCGFRERQESVAQLQMRRRINLITGELRS